MFSEYNYEITSLSLDPFSQKLAGTDNFRYLYIWDLETNKALSNYIKLIVLVSNGRICRTFLQAIPSNVESKW